MFDAARSLITTVYVPETTSCAVQNLTKAGKEAIVKNQLLDKASSIDVGQYFLEKGVPYTDVEKIVANFDIAIDIFCTDGKNFDADYVKGQFKDFSLEPLSFQPL